MGVTRKELLAGGAALALVGCGGSKKAPPAAGPYALDPALRHFDAFLFAAHPKPVRDAIERHRRGLDAGAATYLHEHEEEFDAAVAAAAAAYLGVDAARARVHRLDDDGARAGLRRARARARRRGRHDRARPLRHPRGAAAAGARRCDKVRLYDDPAQATTERHDRRAAGRDHASARSVLALTWVHSGTGVKVPVQELAAALGNRPLVVLDGVHALAVENRPARHPRLRRLRRRHPQVAGRPARHRDHLDDQGLGRRSAPMIPSFVAVRASRRAALHARRLPLLRAPLGAGAGLRVPVRARPRGGRRRASTGSRSVSRTGWRSCRTCG